MDPTATTNSPTPQGFEQLISQLRDALAAAADPSALMDADAAARLLDCSRASLYRAVANGTVPRPVTSPGGPRFKRAELLKAIEKMKPAT